MKKPVDILNKLSFSSNRAWVLAGNVKRVFPDAQKIGEGYFRKAYRVGDYVVKQSSNHGTPKPPKRLLKLKEYDLHVAQQWFMNGWVVQPYYRLAKYGEVDKWAQEIGYMVVDKRISLDLGYGNMGVDEKGRLTAFDW